VTHCRAVSGRPASGRPKIDRRGLAALVVVLAIVVTACSGGSKKTSKGGPGSTAANKTYSLTGRPIDDVGRATRPAATVKIDNNVEARPQAGIDKADVVYEEFTEGITRFVVVFQSSDADSVGPVRSVRPADPVIIFPLGGLLVFSGGSPAVRALVPGAPVLAIDENATDVLKRRSDRAAPHNLYTSTKAIYAKTPPGSNPPPPFAKFLAAGQKFAGSGATPVTHVRVQAADGVTADYDWDAGSGTWPRATDGKPANLEGGGRIAPNNVIVQFTPYQQFAGDSKVQYPQVTGTGDAWIFASGMLVKGKWSKPGPGDVTAFTDSSGAPVVLPPGQTWVHLVKPGAPVTPT
jgi:hypothetical protein